LELPAPVTPDITVQLSATPAQQEMLECTAPIQSWACGRRWGKTLTLRNKFVQFGLMYPGQQFYYLALSYSKAKTEYRRFWQATRQFVTWKSLQPHPEVHWWNGSQFRFLSMDRPDNIRGEGVKLLGCDEASKFDADVVWEVLQPMTADVDGTMIFASTYYGQNWYYDEVQKGLGNLSPDYKSFVYPTPTGYAFEGPGGKNRLERIQRTVPRAVWEQEYLCLPSIGADAVFREVNNVLADIQPLSEREPGRSYVCAWDTGRKSDPSAVLVMDDTGRVVFFEILPLMMEEGKQLERVAGIVAKFNAMLVIDSTGAGTRDWIVGFARQRVRTRVESLYFRTQDKEAMVRQMSLDIEQKNIQIPHCYSALIQQIRNYRYELKGKNYDYGAPDGQHDDGVAALLMACWARKKGWLSMRSGVSLSEMIG
jgi:hypothetical protein